MLFRSQLANSNTIHVSESSVVTSHFLIDLHLSLQDELLALYKATSEQSINIDLIEYRLFDIREKLFKLEEKPELQFTELKKPVVNAIDSMKLILDMAASMKRTIIKMKKDANLLLKTASRLKVADCPRILGASCGWKMK